MPLENDGVMIILSSPSGAGKTTLVNLLIEIKIILIRQFLTQQENLGLTKPQNKLLFCN